MFLSLLVFTMQNCGEYHSMQDSDYSSSFLSDEDLYGEGQRVPFQMLSKKQVLSSLVTVAGLREADEALKTTSLKLSPILSEKSEVIKYNSPRGMTYANIAGDTCRQLIVQEKLEKNKRLITYGLPINISLISPQEIENTIRSFARSFWSRNETVEELQIIKQSLLEFKNVREVASLKEEERAERQTLFLCTSMLSALEAITY